MLGLASKCFKNIVGKNKNSSLNIKYNLSDIIFVNDFVVVD